MNRTAMLIDIEYDGMILRDGLRADPLVGGTLTIEIKSVERLAPVHGKQLLTYLRLTQQPLRLLMNFGASTFREGMKRVLNNHTKLTASPLHVNQISTSPS
ncbi:GxxExxY protein [Allosphingosinicella sp.]|uniref:GxxExxY protein n=1 Tax=Allosphingosinicella sp. TaxID=2823234 RepID=UPI003D735C9D